MPLSKTHGVTEDVTSPTATSRLVRKLALRGQAHPWGVSYQLYIRANAPSQPHFKTYPLLNNTGIKLVSSAVDVLSASGGYMPLSDTAAKAAGYLGGIAISVDSCGHLDGETNNTPSVAVDNGLILLCVPPISLKNAVPEVGRGFLVTLSLETTQPICPSPRNCCIVSVTVPQDGSSYACIFACNERC